jgi:hypothetical protein
MRSGDKKMEGEKENNEGKKDITDNTEWHVTSNMRHIRDGCCIHLSDRETHNLLSCTKYKCCSNLIHMTGFFHEIFLFFIP